MTRPASAEEEAGEPRAVGVPGANPSERTATNIDTDAQARWVLSGYTRTSEMTSKHEGPTKIPKLSDGVEACLNYCCKGRCSNKCPRAGAHKPQGATMTRGLHGYMDACQMART